MLVTILTFIAGAVCLLAALLQLAVYRAPDIKDSPIVVTARRVIIAGLAVAGGYILYGATLGNMPAPVLTLALGLCGFSQTIFALNDLMEHLEQAHPKWGQPSSHPSTYE